MPAQGRRRRSIKMAKEEARLRRKREGERRAKKSSSELKKELPLPSVVV